MVIINLIKCTKAITANFLSCLKVILKIFKSITVFLFGFRVNAKKKTIITT